MIIEYYIFNLEVLWHVRPTFSSFIAMPAKNHQEIINDESSFTTLHEHFGQGKGHLAMTLA